MGNWGGGVDATVGFGVTSGSRRWGGIVKSSVGFGVSGGLRRWGGIVKCKVGRGVGVSTASVSETFPPDLVQYVEPLEKSRQQKSSASPVSQS